MKLSNVKVLGYQFGGNVLFSRYDSFNSIPEAIQYIVDVALKQCVRIDKVTISDYDRDTYRVYRITSINPLRYNRY